MWDDRNDALQTTITPRKVIEIRVINANIRTLYLDGAAHVIHRDCHLFATSLATILSCSLPEKHQWTNTVQQAQSKKRSFTNMIGRRLPRCLTIKLN
jgi:hypothetical protein